MGNLIGKQFTPEQIEEIRNDYMNMKSDDFCKLYGISTKRAIEIWGKKGRYKKPISQTGIIERRKKYEERYRAEATTEMGISKQKVVNKHGITYEEVERLLKRGYGFSELLEGTIINGRLVPKTLIDYKIRAY